MLLGLVGHIETVRFIEGSLFVWIDQDRTFDAHLPHIRPAVSTHPLSLAAGTFVLSEAPLLALVGSQTFSFGASLKMGEDGTSI